MDWSENLDIVTQNEFLPIWESTTSMLLSISCGDSGMESAWICPGFLYRCSACRNRFLIAIERFLQETDLKLRTTIDVLLLLFSLLNPPVELFIKFGEGFGKSWMGWQKTLLFLFRIGTTLRTDGSKVKRENMIQIAMSVKMCPVLALTTTGSNVPLLWCSSEYMCIPTLSCQD